jgi:DNA-binding beta-propeller fold protein YncE
LNRLALLCLILFASAAVEQPAALRHVQTIPLNVEGRIDHFSFDLKTRRLFVCALENNTCEVIDTDAGKAIHTIKGLTEPQGVRHLPKPNRLVIANAIDGSVGVYDASNFQLLHRIDLKNDADNVRHDTDPDRAWVGYGEGALALIDTNLGRVLRQILVGGHPESFQLERHGNRIFVNIPSNQQIAVVDRAAGKVIDTWKLTEKRNFPMALDDDQHRLMVVCREPARMLVIDTQSGKRVAAVDCVGDADDVWFDRETHRVYVSGGEGFVSVIEQSDADHYQALEKVPTDAGARTSILVPAWRKLYVAVPHRQQQAAELRVFEVAHKE